MHKRPLAVIAVFFILGIILGRFLPDSVRLFHAFVVTLILITISFILSMKAFSGEIGRTQLSSALPRTFRPRSLRRLRRIAMTWVDMDKRPLAVIAVFFMIGIILGRFLPDSVRLFHAFVVTLILITLTLIFTLTLTLSHKWERGLFWVRSRGGFQTRPLRFG